MGKVREQSAFNNETPGNLLTNHELEEWMKDLTDREREVLDLIAAGKTNSEIAETLGIGLRTIETHICNVLGKLGVKNRTQAALLWDRYVRGR